MLNLTRRVGESLRINDDITVKVMEVRGNQVSLAIDAPRKIPVHREEVYLRIKKQEAKAGGGK